jgi:hypothetical protein
MSRYIGDPDVIPDHWPQQVLFARGFRKPLAALATLLVPVPISLQATDYCDIPLGGVLAQLRRHDGSIEEAWWLN